MNQNILSRISASLPGGIHKLRKAFLEHGRDIRVVGGAVRDAACGKMPKDIDLCTDADPEEQERIYNKAGIRCIPTGLQHGTWSVLLPGEKDTIEITSLRIDRQTDGRHAQVEWTHDWELDLGRRDLTVNAMSMDMDGVLHDPFGGLEDLKNGRVKFVGRAEDRMREDHLRILRWLRFEGRFGKGRPDAEAFQAATKCASSLKHISRERIWSEIKRIAVGPRSNEMMALFSELDLKSPCGAEGISDDAFADIYQRSSNPVTLIAACTPDTERLGREWKWSREELDLGIFIRNELGNINADFRRMLAVEGIRREHVVELMLITGRPYEASLSAEWDIPACPVGGKHLLEAGIPKGRGMGEVLKRIREEWAASDYTADSETLLANELGHTGMLP